MIRIAHVNDQRGALRLLYTATRVVAVRPKLWSSGISVWFRMARSGWWLRAPFLPIPAKKFLHFRLVTMDGGDGEANADRQAYDIAAWLEWCRSWRALRL